MPGLLANDGRALVLAAMLEISGSSMIAQITAFSTSRNHHILALKRHRCAG
jgi:hypothetical protein